MGCQFWVKGRFFGFDREELVLNLSPLVVSGVSARSVFSFLDDLKLLHLLFCTSALGCGLTCLGSLEEDPV